MWDVILFVYLLGILLSQPVYIWAIGTLCKMEDEDEELYCQELPVGNCTLGFGRDLLAACNFICNIFTAYIYPDGQNGAVGSGRGRRVGSGRGHVLITGWGEIPTLLRWRKLWQLYETPIQTHYLMV